MPATDDGPDDGAAPRTCAPTRALILETAPRLFRERGFDRTTLRAVAAEAGVSVGNASCSFEGREHLIKAGCPPPGQAPGDGHPGPLS